MSLLSKFKLKIPLLKITWGGGKPAKVTVPVKETLQSLAQDFVESKSKKHPPFAKVLTEKMKTKGKYAQGGPLGAVVHFTAGRDGAEKTIKGGIKNGYAYWCIQKDGLIVCAHPADEWGYHAGESKWTHPVYKLVGSVSDDLIGIEINCAGRLTKKGEKFFTWYNVEIPKENVRYTEGKDNQLKGYYEKFTPQQEETLVQTLFWLKDNFPMFSFDRTLGHDEVAGKNKYGLTFWRKNDPGAALSMTMPEFRELLKKRYAAEKGK